MRCGLFSPPVNATFRISGNAGTGRPPTYQNWAAGSGLQAGQAAGQQSSVAAFGVVLQSDAVRLGVLHDQARVLRLRQAGVQFTSAGIHEVRPSRRDEDKLQVASSQKTSGETTKEAMRIKNCCLAT